MARLNTRDTRTARGTGPVVTERTPSGATREGGPGYARDVRGELFLLAVTQLVGEGSFYEKSGDRDDRFVALVRASAVVDAAWTAGLLAWLRGHEANLRTAPVVGALEAVHARLEAKLPSVPAYEVSGVTSDRGVDRWLVDAVLQRADEPGEALAYWTSRYGRALPKPVKRGVADAVTRLYTERALLRYDTPSHGWRFGDVIDLVHPTPDPDRPWQGDLLRHALDRRHGRGDEVPASLRVLRANAEARAAAADGTYGWMRDPDRVRDAGMSWEDVLSLAGDAVEKRLLWEALVDSMGYMSLARNLRNLDEAGVSDEVAARVAVRLADPGEVARSRQLPLRFLAAYREAPSLRWAHPLERALQASLSDVPALGGRTLVLVDTSTSMRDPLSARSKVLRWDAAASFGLALAARCAHADVVSFSSAARMYGDAHAAHTKVFTPRRGESLLRAVERWDRGGYFLGGGTATCAAVRAHLAGHDRVVILTDEQAGGDGPVDQVVPRTTPLYTFNLAGYRHGHAPGGPNRYTLGGLTDASFRVIPLVESGRAGRWPWESQRTPVSAEIRL